MRRTVVGLVGVAAMALAACGGGGGGGGGGGADEPDSGAFLACRSFRDAAADFEKLTRGELRDRLSGVDEDAQLSDEPGVATAARSMVVALTSGTDAEAAEAVEAMDAACSQAGA